MVYREITAHVLNFVAVHFKSAEQVVILITSVLVRSLVLNSLHGAEKKGLLLGQLYVGPNSMWAKFVTVVVQCMYCLVLCCVM